MKDNLTSPESAQPEATLEGLFVLYVTDSSQTVPSMNWTLSDSDHVRGLSFSLEGGVQYLELLCSSIKVMMSMIRVKEYLRFMGAHMTKESCLN